MQKQIRTLHPLILVGGGPVTQGELDDSLEDGAILVAADGGADTCHTLGRVPDWGIGDLDSMSLQAQERFAPGRLIHDSDQDTTDLEKCLSRITAPLILGLGFLGGRLDHELAALSALIAYDGALVLLGAEDLVFHLRAPLMLDLPEGTRLSLFPMQPGGGRSEGLLWPIDGLDMAAGARVGTSNRVTGPVLLDPAGPGLLAILPREALAAVRAALAASPARPG